MRGKVWSKMNLYKGSLTKARDDDEIRNEIWGKWENQKGSHNDITFL